ncbi:MAG: hypothetical protein ACI9EF_001402 [Pseudohongiellaceae bacterium]
MKSLPMILFVAAALVGRVTTSSVGRSSYDAELAGASRSPEFLALDIALQGYFDYLQSLGHRGRPPIQPDDEAIVLSRFGLPHGYEPRSSQGPKVVLDGSPGKRGPLHAFVASRSLGLRFSPYNFQMSLVRIDASQASVSLSYSKSVRAPTDHGTVCHLVWTGDGWAINSWSGWVC